MTVDKAIVTVTGVQPAAPSALTPPVSTAPDETAETVTYLVEVLVPVNVVVNELSSPPAAGVAVAPETSSAADS